MKNNEIKLNFRITNPTNFIAFLKKIKAVDKSSILELESTNFFAKVRTADKSVIKYVSMDISDFLEGDIPKERIKIGIMEINKIIDSFKYFGTSEEIFLSITAQPVDGDILATGVKIHSKSITITIRCADVSLLTYMDDNIQKMIHSTDNNILSFPMSKENFNKVSMLVGMDNNQEELLNFDSHEGKMVIRGNSFEYIIATDDIKGFKSSDTYTIYKNQFSNIDQEDSEVYIQENRIIVISSETDSKIAIGRVEME